MLEFVGEEEAVPKGAKLALLLSVDCVGLQEPTGREIVEDARDRTYVLSERLAVIAPIPGKRIRKEPAGDGGRTPPRFERAIELTDSEMSPFSDLDERTA
ncbi:hypothetical protein BCR44DRAFT_51620 [Catenaria anguillulae PL171]|uniref:Uncharacterized protein n=1 Tax=Catenaria anguillulae PL171 TaxID=765915 RepID=A0A1Y2HP40_9FUNG|nr:hypothetical protein BCR44DRAFT_51620 [Catenaria anguillulae PL171]